MWEVIDYVVPFPQGSYETQTPDVLLAFHLSGDI